MKEPWKDKRLRKPWKRPGWRPYVKMKGDDDEDEEKTNRQEPMKEIEKKSNLRVGWMIWWRSLLPCLILSVLLSWLLETNTLQVSLFMLPVFFFLLNRAGKTVAQREYDFETPYFIAWNIFWRTILPSIPLGMVGMYLNYLSSVVEPSLALIMILFVYFPLSMFATILILGWATNRAIERLLSV